VRIRVNQDRLAARSLRIAIDADPTIEARHDEDGLRRVHMSNVAGFSNVPVHV